MADLLRTPKAVPHLLEFLRATEVDFREGAVARQEEWEERRDREGKEE